MLTVPHILLPGPTPIPEPVQRAMLAAMSDHRGATFQPVIEKVTRELAQLLRAPSARHIAVLPASGTGGLEAVLQNFLSPKDSVLLIETGLFGKRFGEIAQAMDLSVDTLKVPWGQAFDPPSIVERLGEKPYQAVLVTHNETSTGVLNPVDILARHIQDLTNPPLLLVDSISGLPSVPFDMTWGVDIVIAASQKGFMCPPGLAIVGVSGKAFKALQIDRPHRFYFDLRPYFDGRLPYTPAVSLWHGLSAALDLLQEEGETARFARHGHLRDMVRAFGQAGGFAPLVDSRIASPTVTALQLPESESPHVLRRQLNRRGLQIAGGLGPWHDRVIRIGHVGAVDEGDLWAGLGLLAPFLPNPQAALIAALNITSQGGFSS